MKTIKNLDHALKLANIQLSAQDLISRRIYLKNKGWADVKLSDEFNNQLADMVAELLGGWRKTKNNVKCTLIWGRPYHWGLKRIFVVKYKGMKHARLTYCAGQDYQVETQQIRNALK